MRSLQLFTELGYAQAKGARTRMFNKLQLEITEEIDDDTVNMILDEIIASKSKAEIKAKAKELKGSIEKIEGTVGVTKEVSKPKVKVTLDVSNELLVKYGVSMEDVQEKYNILYNQNALDKESLANRKSIYRFPYDKQIISLLEELCL